MRQRAARAVLLPKYATHLQVRSAIGVTNDSSFALDTRGE